MARLSRVHFASIGHRDARLSPLTLDLRGGDGVGTDTMVWLRNGGGKSSLLNLFYALFRPNRREFLGSNAEGRSRRLEDYVRGTDLGAVVTEWVSGVDGEGQALLDEPALLVGMVLSWRGQQRSADASRLRRLFFSLRAGSRAQLEDLPLQGLAGQAQSYEALREWLDELARARPHLEVVRIEDNLRQWEGHLEQLDLDPEIFRYQIQMNQREGAADEQFRFSSAREFVSFLLELAFPTRHADQVSASLDSLREQLRRRPVLELERRFLSGAQARLEPLAEAVQRQQDALRRRDALRAEIAGVAVALEGSVARLQGAARAAQLDGVEATEQARVAASERERSRRWARGLERLAASLDVEQARAGLAAAQETQDAADQDLRLLRAAEALGQVVALTAREEALREAIRQEQLAHEPARQALEAAGVALSLALQAEETRQQGILGDHQAALQAAEAALKAGALVLEGAQIERGQLEAELKALQGRLSARNQARELLRAANIVEDREDAVSAQVRWEAQDDALQEERERRDAALVAEEQALEHLATARQDLAVELAAHAARADRLERDLQAALQWQERLREDPVLQEAVEADSPVLDADGAGMVSTLREKAEAHHRRLLELAVDDAEDQRAVAGVEETGLLPPSRDVELVVQALQALRLPAFPGRVWLAQNAPTEQRQALFATAPACFDGVIVTDPAALPAALALDLGLRGPVQVSLPRLQADAPAEAVVLPGEAGSWDTAAARVRLDAVLGRRQSRAEQVREHRQRQERLRALAEDLQRFLSRWGDGQLGELREQTDAARITLQGLEIRARELADEQQQRQEHRQEHRQRLREISVVLAQTQRALERLESFVRQFEDHVAGWRDEHEQKGRRRQTLEQEEIPAARAHQALAEQTRQAAAEALRQTRERQEGLVRERQGIQWCAADMPPGGAEHGGVVSARERYAALLRQWENALSQSSLQGQLTEIRRQLEPAQASQRRLARGLVRADVEAHLARGGLEGRREQAEQALQRSTQAVGKAEAELANRIRTLEQLQGRREGADLPPGEAPATPLAARQQAEACLLEAEQSGERETLARQRERTAALEAERTEQSALQRRSHLQILTNSVGTLPAAAAGVLPEDDGDLTTAVLALQARWREAEEGVRAGTDAARQHAEALQRFANEERFQEHRSQIRERLRDPAEELMPRAAEHQTAIASRMVVIDAHMAGIKADEQALLAQIDEVSQGALDVLEQAERASRMPDRFAAWAGRAFLRVQFRVPTSREERLVRLGAMVERLVAGGSIPGGLALTQQAVEALVGSQGFEATILKPDAHLRAERIPIAAMSTFSRGQQLTAAIMLYCTLVRLRARSRGRARADAGVLILDNPVGTCSSVPLLDLQLHIARAMGVQLIYTTGVHDHDALSTFPNTVRLRNIHRDRLTGHHHVTVDGVVEGTRVAARDT